MNTYLNYTTLIEDINNKISNENLEISSFCKKNGFSKSTIYRIRNHEPLTMKTFLFFINWVGKCPEKYFTNKCIEKPSDSEVVAIRRKSLKKEVNPITGF